MKAEKIRLIFREIRYIHSGCHWMPRQERMPDSFHRFNQSVRCEGTDSENFSRIFDCLMVEAVDLGLLSDQVGQHCIFQCADEMDRIMPESGSGAVDKEIRLLGQILVNGCRRRQESEAAFPFADTEDRLSECFRRKVRKSSWNRSKS